MHCKDTNKYSKSIVRNTKKVYIRYKITSFNKNALLLLLSQEHTRHILLKQRQTQQGS